MAYPESNKSIRVLFIDHTSRLGGGEIALRNLLGRLDPNRVCSIALLCEEGPLAEQLRLHHPVHVVPLTARVAETRKDSVGWNSLLRVRELISIFSVALKMARFMRQRNIQVVHTNSLKSHVIGGLAAKFAGRPLVWHLRDRIAPDYLPRTAIFFVRALSRVLPNFIIANSQATLNTILDNIPERDAHNQRLQCRVIHDGCEIPNGSTEPRPSGPVRIGLIGRISPWKGQHIFIKAAAHLRNEFPDVRFQVIGAPLFSETEYESELKALCHSLAMKDRIEFLGFVTDVQRAVARLEIVVHASTVGEPFGQVVIEGMAAGKPVIATRGGGIPEIVVDNVTGLLVPAGDDQALAEAIGSLLRDPEKARKMGECGRERVTEYFTIERSARAVEQVYRDVFDASASNRGRRRSMTPEPADLNQ